MYQNIYQQNEVRGSCVLSVVNYSTLKPNIKLVNRNDPFKPKCKSKMYFKIYVILAFCIASDWGAVHNLVASQYNKR